MTTELDKIMEKVMDKFGLKLPLNQMYGEVIGSTYQETLKLLKEKIDEEFRADKIVGIGIYDGKIAKYVFNKLDQIFKECDEK